MITDTTLTLGSDAATARICLERNARQRGDPVTTHPALEDTPGRTLWAYDMGQLEPGDRRARRGSELDLSR